MKAEGVQHLRHGLARRSLHVDGADEGTGARAHAEHHRHVRRVGFAAGSHDDFGVRVTAIAVDRLQRGYSLTGTRERRRRAVPLDDGATKVIFRETQRPFKDDAAHALGRKKVVGQHNTVASKRRIHLHILVQAEAEEVRHALAYLDHGERRTDARFDNLGQLGILHGGASHLQPHLHDRLTDVVGNSRLGGRREQKKE